MARLSLKALFIILLTVILFACESDNKQNFLSTDISGASFGQDFQLLDHTAEKRTLSDFKDSVVVVFFGYTQCPDMCPATMGILAETLRTLGDDAGRVQVLFVTIDPNQDTPEKLEQYLSHFDASFVGLTGDKAAIDSVVEEFKVYSKVQTQEDGVHSVDHSTGTYLFDTNGNIRLYASYGSGKEVFLRVFSKGSLFGHRSYFAKTPYHANTVALNDTEVMIIPQAECQRICEHRPDLLLQVVQGLAKDLGNAELRLAGLQDKSVAIRVCEALVFLKLKYPEQVWRRKEIADFSVTTFESVARVMTQLAEKNIIIKDGRNFQINDLEKLLHFNT